MDGNMAGRTVRSICPCGRNPLMSRGIYRGKQVYKAVCWTCREEGRKHKKDYCEQCGFKTDNMRELDLDHINAKGWDNRPENLQTLCKECHKAKTVLNEEWRWKDEV
jgi:protein-arginine kinase activator protein McsA